MYISLDCHLSQKYTVPDAWRAFACGEMNISVYPIPAGNDVILR